MNVTAFLMGDPPPGRSALEQRSQSQGITLAGRTWNSKLTAAKVAMIRASNETTQNLAREFGMSIQSINDVRSYRTWKHV